MNGFSTLMFIFGGLVLLAGLYMVTGHKIGILEGRPVYKNLNIDEWKKIGKYTIFSSIIIFVIAVIGLISNFE